MDKVLAPFRFWLGCVIYMFNEELQKNHFRIWLLCGFIANLGFTFIGVIACLIAYYFGYFTG